MANFTVGRNLGLVSQPPKGTGTGSNILSLNFTSVANSIVTVSIPSVGAYIQGDVTTDATSSFNIGTNSTGDIFNTMYVAGTSDSRFRADRLSGHGRCSGSTHDQWQTRRVTANATERIYPVDRLERRSLHHGDRRLCLIGERRT